MLADEVSRSNEIGVLGEGVHKPRTFLRELLRFISEQLPLWRDRVDRPPLSSETGLTSQLCAHLNSAARRSVGWDVLQFRVEETDQTKKARKIDLVASPASTVLWIAGRRHTDFDTILPIECKRLPIPSGTKRDPREYVFSKYSSTGGIQRFKNGDHGAAHTQAAMIAYIQEERATVWYGRVATWINDLSHSAAGWSTEDVPRIEGEDRLLRMTTLRSTHRRQGDLPLIELKHLWLEMTESSS